MLVVVAGLPGTGKSTFATALAHRLSAVWLSVDPVEAAMLRGGVAAGWSTGVAAYEVVGRLAADNARLGRPVIIDAVSDSEPARETWRRAARSAGVALAFVVMTCGDVDTHQRRLAGRQRDVEPIQEPTWSAVQSRAEKYQPWTEPHLLLDSLDPVDVLVDRAVEYCRSLEDFGT